MRTAVRDKLVGYLLAMIGTVVLTFALVFIDRIEGERRLLVARGETLERLNVVRGKLEGAITGPLLRTRGMAAQIIAHDGVADDEFERVAEVLLAGHRNVRNMAVSRGTVITLVYPRGRDQGIIGVDYRNLPHQWPVIRRAIETRQPLLQGPVKLIQGGEALILRAPIFLRSGVFWGIVSIVLDKAGILADAGLDQPDPPIRLAIRGQDGLGAAGDMVFGDQSVFSQQPVTVDASLPQGTWQLAAVPSGGWKTADPELVRIRVLGGLLVALLAGAMFAAAHLLSVRDRANQLLRERTAALERTTGELERFTEILAHHLQEPVRLQHSYTDRLERLLPEPLSLEAREAMDFVRKGALRLRALLRDVQLYLAVDRMPPPRSCLANAAFDAAAGRMAGKIAAVGGSVERTDLPAVWMDEGRLADVLAALLDNAVRFRRQDVPLKIRVSGELHGGCVELFVSDNGIGIPAEFRERVFGVFEKLGDRDDDSGTGIGLAMVRKIVEAAGGRACIEAAADGGGICFRLTLPAGGARR